MSTTFFTRVQKKPDWLLVDADGQIVGRLASRLARILQGKHKPAWTPHIDSGDYVVVLNAARLRFTGNKLHDKEYVWHTRWPGGLKRKPAKALMAEDPGKILQEAVRRMMPKTRLGRTMLHKLKVYAGGEHRHAANRPRPYSIPA